MRLTAPRAGEPATMSTSAPRDRRAAPGAVAAPSAALQLRRCINQGQGHHRALAAVFNGWQQYLGSSLGAYTPASPSDAQGRVLHHWRSRPCRDIAYIQNTLMPICGVPSCYPPPSAPVYSCPVCITRLAQAAANNDACAAAPALVSARTRPRRIRTLVGDPGPRGVRRPTARGQAKSLICGMTRGDGVTKAFAQCPGCPGRPPLSAQGHRGPVRRLRQCVAVYPLRRQGRGIEVGDRLSPLGPRVTEQKAKLRGAAASLRIAAANASTISTLTAKTTGFSAPRVHTATAAMPRSGEGASTGASVKEPANSKTLSGFLLAAASSNDGHTMSKPVTTAQKPDAHSFFCVSSSNPSTSTTPLRALPN